MTSNVYLDHPGFIFCLFRFPLFNTTYIELLHIRIAVKGNLFKLLKIASAGNVRKAAAIIALATVACK